MGFEDYIGQVSTKKHKPEDPFGLASSVGLETDVGKVGELNQLINKLILMGNIDDNKLIRVYQKQLGILVRLCDMKRREPEIKTFFETRYYQIINEISMTRIKGGMERLFMATAGNAGYSRNSDFSGYGNELLATELNQARENGGGTNPISAILKNFKRRRQDYG